MANMVVRAVLLTPRVMGSQKVYCSPRGSLAPLRRNLRRTLLVLPVVCQSQLCSRRRSPALLMMNPLRIPRHRLGAYHSPLCNRRQRLVLLMMSPLRTPRCLLVGCQSLSCCLRQTHSTDRETLRPMQVHPPAACPCPLCFRHLIRPSTPTSAPDKLGSSRDRLAFHSISPLSQAACNLRTRSLRLLREARLVPRTHLLRAARPRPRSSLVSRLSLRATCRSRRLTSRQPVPAQGLALGTRSLGLASLAFRLAWDCRLPRLPRLPAPVPAMLISKFLLPASMDKALACPIPTHSAVLVSQVCQRHSDSHLALSRLAFPRAREGTSQTQVDLRMDQSALVRAAQQLVSVLVFRRSLHLLCL